MSWTTRLPGVLLVLGGILGGLETTTFETFFMTDPIGPKALPGLAAFVLVLAGAHVTVRPSTDYSWLTSGALIRTGSATLAFLLYAVALPLVGFFASTTVVVATLSALFGATLRKAIPAAAMLTGGLWLIFVAGLGLPLPIGSLWIR